MFSVGHRHGPLFATAGRPIQDAFQLSQDIEHGIDEVAGPRRASD
jgi:hypothetical protein